MPWLRNRFRVSGARSRSASVFPSISPLKNHTSNGSSKPSRAAASIIRSKLAFSSKPESPSDPPKCSLGLGHSSSPHGTTGLVRGHDALVGKHTPAGCLGSGIAFASPVLGQGRQAFSPSGQPAQEPYIEWIEQTFSRCRFYHQVKACLLQQAKSLVRSTQMFLRLGHCSSPHGTTGLVRGHDALVGKHTPAGCLAPESLSRLRCSVKVGKRFPIHQPAQEPYIEWIEQTFSRCRFYHQVKACLLQQARSCPSDPPKCSSGSGIAAARTARPSVEFHNSSADA